MQAPNLSSGTTEFKPLNPLATVLGHLRLICLVGLVGTLILGFLVLQKFHPVYSAQSAIEVELVYSRILFWDQEKQFSSRTQYTDFINTQVRYIVGADNLTLAIEKMALPNAALEPGRNNRETLFRLMRMINVAWVPDTHLISVSIEGNQPKDLDTIVNAIVDAYLETAHIREVGKNDSRIQYLQNERVKKQAELDKLYAEMVGFTEQLGTFNFSEELNPFDQDVRGLRDQINEARLARIQAENELAGLVFSLERQRNLDMGPLVEEFVQNDLSTVEMRNLTFSTQEELDRQSTFLTDEHPSKIHLKEFANTAKKSLEDALGESRERAASILWGKLQIEQQVQLAKAEADVAAKRETERQLVDRMAAAETRLIATTPDFLRATQIGEEMDRLQTRLQEIESRIEEIILEAQGHGRMSIQSRAVTPLYPLKDRRKFMLVMVAIMSLIMGVFLAFALDFLDMHLTDPQFIAKQIGKRPTGILPHFPHIEDFGTLLQSAPDSFHADQFRRIMPKIFNEGSGEPPPRRIAVLSLRGRSGSTSIALNCVKHLRNIGEPVALVDLNIHSPSLPRRFPAGDLKPLNLSMPAKIAAGLPLEHRQAEGVSIHYFAASLQKESLSNESWLVELMERLQPAPGVLILDAPPLLEHAESELICRHCDLVLLVISPDNVAGDLKQGLTMLEELNVGKCAVVANNLPLLPGSNFRGAIARHEGRPLRNPILLEVLEALENAFPFLPLKTLKSRLQGRPKTG